ncbi:MAG: hypothetical protein ACRERD_17015, partial [Candidatus Binatia bacterium]
MRNLWCIIAGLCMGGAVASPVQAEEELKQLIDRLLAPPTIEAQAGFTATVLVAPGSLYDPLFMLPRDGAVWLNDDGKEEKDKGSRLLSIDGQGK